MLQNLTPPDAAFFGRGIPALQVFHEPREIHEARAQLLNFDLAREFVAPREVGCAVGLPGRSGRGGSPNAVPIRA